MSRIRFLILVFICSTIEISAQTCCSGGVPLTNNIGGLPMTDARTMQVTLNMDVNILNTLKEGSNTLDDDSRKRVTYSGLLKGAFSISSRLSVEGLFTWVRQERIIRQGAFENFTSTSGIGDAVLMLNYNYYNWKNFQFIGGAGAKLPLGKSDLSTDNGITLTADLQPGSGALDGLFTHRTIYNSSRWPTLSVNSMITYRITGKNEDYLGGQVYQFGNELQVITGVTDQVVLGNGLFNVGTNLRYREVNRDRIDGVDLPNTGGAWLFLMPVVAWHITPKSSVMLSTEFPLYSRVDGTQLSPTIRINGGIYFSFQKREVKDIVIKP